MLEWWGGHETYVRSQGRSLVVPLGAVHRESKVKRRRVSRYRRGDGMTHELAKAKRRHFESNASLCPRPTENTKLNPPNRSRSSRLSRFLFQYPRNTLEFGINATIGR